MPSGPALISALLMSVTVSCMFSDGSGAGQPAVTSPQSPAAVDPDSRHVVTVMPPPVSHLPPLDPDADPQTPLGDLRARYLPVWTPDLDWAFPPEACGSAWELDGIAVPLSGVDLSPYGDPAAMAALGVMRYEFLVSRALAEPTPIAQLCVAVAAVGHARSAVLDALALVLADTTAAAGDSAAEYPSEVALVAASPSEVLAVACVPPAVSIPAVSDDRPVPSSAAASRAVVRTYLLAMTRGVEDAVVDVSYRVSRTHEHEGDACSGIDERIAAWERSVAQWSSAGQPWAALRRRRITAEQLCLQAHDGGTAECPQDWPA
ncbi:hypothetical protein [Candidatus Poriferisodalis sp.]|uniref:hypothetical protein n=1 Tax=Candidatus Poriferisodalis sp. TaxID=3101277 RepID=UPI003B020A34